MTPDDELLLDDVLLEDELDDELLVTSPLEEDDELLDELELLEPDEDPPWVTNRLSPPQALKAATAKPTVSARKDFRAALCNPRDCNPIENMMNTPHKCLIRLHTQVRGRGTTYLLSCILAAKNRVAVRRVVNAAALPKILFAIAGTQGVQFFVIEVRYS